MSAKYALPSLEESQQLRQAESIVHNNLVQMECEELLKEITVDYDSLDNVSASLFTLRELLMKAPSQTVCAAEDPSNASSPSSTHDTNDTDYQNATPLQLPSGTSMRRWTTDLSNKRSGTTTLAFTPPTEIELMGSFLLRTIAKPKCTVDLAIHMPSNCFASKDILDYRYHDKRLLYLTCLYEHLTSMNNNTDNNNEEEDTNASTLFEHISIIGFTSIDDVASKPILTLTPRRSKAMSKTEKMFTFHLHLIAPVSIFNVNKLSPSSGNLRIHRHSSTGERLPTPRYNCSILEDLYYLRHLRGLHTFSTQLYNPDSFSETCLLLKLWCRKRNYHKHRDSMNGFHLTVLLAHLLDTRVVHAHGTPRQMFTTVMEWISNNNFGKTGIAITCLAKGEIKNPRNEDDDSEGKI